MSVTLPPADGVVIRVAVIVLPATTFTFPLAEVTDVRLMKLV